MELDLPLRLRPLLQTLRQGIRLLDRADRAKWFALVVLAIGVSVVEAIGAVLVLGMLGIVTGQATSMSLPLVGNLEDRFPGTDQDRLFLVVAATIGAFFMIRACAYLLQSYLQARVSYDAGVRLSTRLLRGYLRLPYAFHLRHNSSELMRNIFGSVNESVAYVFVPTVEMVSETLLALAIGAVLVATAPIATIATAVTIVPLIFLVQRFVQPRIARLGIVTSEASSDSFKLMQESLQGIRDVQVLGRSEYFVERFTDTRRRLAEAFYQRSALSMVPRVTIETMAILFIVVFLAVATLRDGDTAEGLAVLGLFAYAIMRLLPSVTKIVGHANNLKFGAAAISILEQAVADVSASEDGTEPRRGIPFKSEIRVVGVSFQYEGAETNVLRDVSLRIARGESIGIAGPTGGGKTTLVDVIVGLLEPTQGSVLVDGLPISENLNAWHAHLGVVPQSVFLLDDTLRRNIAFGIDDTEVDDFAVNDAVRRAQLSEVLASLPEGLDTVVGERGVRLSGGQRQRVAIARALYRKPDVIVFDEGTSALDNLTEAEIIRAMESLRGECTILAVAHRLTTVRNCDRILLMEDGAIIADGQYDELVRDSASFRRLTQ